MKYSTLFCAIFLSVFIAYEPAYSQICTNGRCSQLGAQLYPPELCPGGQCYQAQSSAVQPSPFPMRPVAVPVGPSDFGINVNDHAVKAHFRVRVDRQQGIQYGSGVVIGSNSRHTYILTARHAVDPYVSQGTGSQIHDPIVKVTVDNHVDRFEARVLARSSGDDLALLEIDKGDFPWVRKIAPSSQSVPNVLTSAGGENGNFAEPKTFRVYRPLPDGTVELYDRAIPGQSGSGLFGPDGFIYGIMKAVTSNGHGIYTDLRTSRFVANYR